MNATRARRVRFPTASARYSSGLIAGPTPRPELLGQLWHMHSPHLPSPSRQSLRLSLRWSCLTKAAIALLPIGGWRAG